MTDAPRSRDEKAASDAAANGLLSAAELRCQAEERLKREGPLGDPVMSIDTAQVLHELRVHQVELEMQNETLRRAQLETEEQRAKYYELFDLAPVGYLTLSEKDIVDEANFTAAHLLGVARRELVGRPFHAFVLAADQEAYFLHRRLLERTGAPQSCELRLRRGGELFWAHLESQPQHAGGGEPLRYHVTLTDVPERALAQEKLRESEAKYRDVVERATDGIAILQEGLVLFANEALASMTGYSVGELTGMSFLAGAHAVQHETEERVRRRLAGEDEPSAYEIDLVRKDGTAFTAEVSAGVIAYEGAPADLVLLRDITARKQAESYREMGRVVLQILNEPGDLQDSMRHVLAVLKTKTGLDAVGIRLQDGEDFPYFTQAGFSDGFLRTENTLLERDADGEVRRDSDGRAKLECTCGLVISGKTDPSSPLFTAGGSFWSNDAFPLLDLPPAQDPRHNPRNTCMHQGYASMALVPIRSTDGIVGLIHLDDRRKGRFTLEAIELLEDIAAHLAAALLRKRAEEALRESEERHKEMIANISDVIAIMAVDGTICYKSPNIERHFGWLPQDLVDTDGWETVHPDDLERIQGEFLALLDEDRSVATVEYRYKCRDGSYKSIELTATNLVNNPLIDGVLMNYHDITARRRAEVALARLNDELTADTAALAEANATITQIAATDVLTGLANRRHFYESIEKAVSLARRHGSPLALLSLDLDGLKQVNDSAGHKAGDEVLASFAALLADLCRAEDLPARLGGDEFCVLLPGMELGGAQGLAERVLAAVRSCAALAQRRVTVSAGVAQWTPDEIPDDLLRRADEALYAAKRGGGDAVAAQG